MNRDEGSVREIRKAGFRAEVVAEARLVSQLSRSNRRLEQEEAIPDRDSGPAEFGSGGMEYGGNGRSGGGANVGRDFGKRDAELPCHLDSAHRVAAKDF